MKDVISRDLITSMFHQTKTCVSKHPHLKSHPNLCEVAYISQLSDKDSFTLHTHPDHRADYPSDADIRTTNMLGKKNLCIILANGKTRCWNHSDNFNKPTEEF